MRSLKYVRSSPEDDVAALKVILRPITSTDEHSHSWRDFLTGETKIDMKAINVYYFCACCVWIECLPWDNIYLDIYTRYVALLSTYNFDLDK